MTSVYYFSFCKSLDFGMMFFYYTNPIFLVNRQTAMAALPSDGGGVQSLAWRSRRDYPPAPSEGRACPSLFDCHGPRHWDLALARVQAAHAAPELSACQKFKF